MSDSSAFVIDGVPELPLTSSPVGRAPPTVSYGKILQQAVVCVDEALSMTEGMARVTLDYPPERSETRAGTLVSRFENNLNFISKLAGALNDGGEPEVLGPPVEIRDNVNPQGGGEYITDDECMVGLRTMRGGRVVTILMNAGVDAATLKQVQQYDVPEGITILVNCALDRVSWFAKLGFAKYIDSFAPLYYLKSIAPNGWLIKASALSTAKWYLFLYDGQPVLLEQYDDKPSIVDAESKVRMASVRE